jgi:hypothetical protein
MSVIERRSPVKLSFQIPLPSEGVLIAIIVVGFFILHVMAGAILQNASPAAPATMSQDEPGPSLYD